MQMHHPEHDWLQRKKHESACQVWYRHLWSADKKRKEISGGPEPREEVCTLAERRLLRSDVVSIEFDRVHVEGQAIRATRSLSSALEMKSEKRRGFAEAFSRSPGLRIATRECSGGRLEKEFWQPIETLLDIMANGTLLMCGEHSEATWRPWGHLREVIHHPSPVMKRKSWGAPLWLGGQ